MKSADSAFTPTTNENVFPKGILTTVPSRSSSLQVWFSNLFQILLLRMLTTVVSRYGVTLKKFQTVLYKNSVMRSRIPCSSSGWFNVRSQYLILSESRGFTRNVAVYTHDRELDLSTLNRRKFRDLLASAIPWKRFAVSTDSVQFNFVSVFERIGWMFRLFRSTAKSPVASRVSYVGPSCRNTEIRPFL